MRIKFNQFIKEIPDSLNLSESEKFQCFDNNQETPEYQNHWSRGILKALELLKVNLEVELSNANDLKNELNKNGIRYRIIENEPISNNVDYGVLILTSKDKNSTEVLNYKNKKSDVYSFTQSSGDSTYTEKNINNLLEEASSIIEIYPPLPYDLKDLFGFLQFIFKSFKRDMSFVILFTSISMGLQLLFPQLTVYVATNVISLGSIPFALQIGVLAIILAFLSSGALYIQSLFILKLETETDKRAQVSVWDRLLKADLENINSFTSADLMLRASTISEIKKLLSSSNITSLISILFSFFYLFIMYGYFPEPLIGVIPIVILFLIFVINKAKTGGKLLSKSLDIRANLTTTTNEIILLQNELRTRGSDNSFISRWIRLTRSFANLSSAYRSRDNSIEIMSEAFQPLCFLVSFIIIKGSISSEDLEKVDVLIPLLGYTASLTLFTSNLANGANTVSDSFVRVMAYWKRATPIVFTPIESGYRPGSKAHEFDGSIFLDNIKSINRINGSTIFEGINIKFKPFESTILLTKDRVANKIFKYILNIEKCNFGSIFISGIPIEQLSIPSLRSQIAYSSIDKYLPMGPLGDLLEGPLIKEEEDLAELIDTLCLNDLFINLRMGLSTPVPEGGKCFSTNQIEKLTLAMCICRYPKVLLVEDSLSGFSNNELKIFLNYLKIKKITLIAFETSVDNQRQKIYDDSYKI